MIARREFTLIAATLALARVGHTQPTAKLARVGFLGSSLHRARIEGFLAGLRQLGYFDGRTVIIEWRMSEGRVEQLSELALELARLRVDVIVAQDNPTIAASQKATKTIPIVMILASDPVASGFVSSLAKPGGNTTGLTSQVNDVQGKLLQLVKEALPKLSRVFILWNPSESGRRAIAREAEMAAGALGLHAHLVSATSRGDLETFFTTVAREPSSAVLLQPSQLNFLNRARIAQLAKQRLVPTVGWSADTVEAGWLMSYGPDIIALYRRAAYFVDKLLKGVKPADLPIERPTTFELVLNLTTAEALGLSVPTSLQARADRIVH